MYNKVSTDLKFVEREKEVEKFWEDHDIFGKSIEDREGHPTYMFYDDGQRQTSYRPRADPRHQRHDSEIPDHEGV